MGSQVPQCIRKEIGDIGELFRMMRAFTQIEHEFGPLPVTLEKHDLKRVKSLLSANPCWMLNEIVGQIGRHGKCSVPLKRCSTNLPSFLCD